MTGNGRAAQRALVPGSRNDEDTLSRCIIQRQLQGVFVATRQFGDGGTDVDQTRTRIDTINYGPCQV
jgi:hypothetical protein